jgi:DNA polymerase alpha subunit B N-terminal
VSLDILLFAIFDFLYAATFRLLWNCETYDVRNIDLTHFFTFKVIALSESLSVSPMAIGECWEAYSLTKQVKSLDTHSFQAFRSKLVSELDNPVALATVMNDDKNSAVRVTAFNKRDMSSVVITPAHLNKKRPTSSGSESTSSDYRRISLSPNATRTHISSQPMAVASLPSSSAPLVTYDGRKGAGTVVVSYNPSSRTMTPSCIIEINASGVLRERPKCTITTNFPSNVTEPFRHWFTVLDDRAMALDVQLQQHTSILNERYNFGSEQIAAVEAIGVPRQDTICCIGRICNAVSILYLMYL